MESKDNRKFQNGDIAFLRSYTEFSSWNKATLIDSGYLTPSVTNHPVIVVERSPAVAAKELVAITTVSAYTSGPHNNFTPPWKCPWRRKGRRESDFVSFEGSEQPSVNGEERNTILRLRDGKSMPKPRASWVYLQSLWVVPASVISRFDRWAGCLRLTDESLGGLRQDFRRKCVVAEHRFGDHRILCDSIATAKAEQATCEGGVAKRDQQKPLSSRNGRAAARLLGNGIGRETEEERNLSRTGTVSA